MPKKTVLIGGVAGGATTAARLRRLDPDMEIIILDKGEYISFANCGLPYHLGGVAKKRESIIIHTPDSMKEKYNIDVRIQNEVTEIDRQGKSLTVKNHATGESYRESYDTLVVSTGSSPLVPPIPGIDGRGIFTLWTIPDMDRIKAYMEENKPKTVTIIGGGFVGLEVAENLAHVGMNVTVVEMASQVMAPIDPEMAEYVHENLRNEGVRLILGDGVSSFESKKGGIEVKTQNEQVLPSDMVILSIGVRPNTRILKEAGIELNERGFVKVDSLLKTSDKDIYALGDIIETDDIVTGGKTSVPLAGPANKQGRIVANNICGMEEHYKGVLGTSIVRLFDQVVASTGINEKKLENSGQKKDRDYFVVKIDAPSHAAYLPDSQKMHIKVLFETGSKRALGAQVVGKKGVDKKIDALATLIYFKGTVDDLKNIDYAYSPPFSSAKDALNIVGYVGE